MGTSLVVESRNRLYVMGNRDYAAILVPTAFYCNASQRTFGRASLSNGTQHSNAGHVTDALI
jgi:hypothetical protein